MTRLKDLFEYLDCLDNCSDDQFLKFVDAMKKRGYEFVSQYVHDYDYPHVTHCKDCKHFHPNAKNTVMNCRNSHGLLHATEDDYCSKAERKKD